MNRSTVRAPALVTLLALIASTALTAVALPAGAASQDPAVVQKSATAKTSSWFHDPVSKTARKTQIAVPKNPTAYRGKLRDTKATYRTASGSIAVPVTWAKGHQLAKGQAVVLDKNGLFPFDKSTPTKSAKRQVAQLNKSLSNAASIRCEGYTDFGGSASNERKLSKKRAAAICKLLDAKRPSLKTSTVGYGGKRPVVVGGKASKRAENRRVIVVVTKAKPAKATPKPPAPKPAAKVPGAPTLQQATAANGAAQLRFAAPSSNGGAAITKYQVTTNAGTTWRALTTTGGSPFVATVSDLTNGSTYPVRVRAVNAVGNGPASNSLSVTPVAVPAPPVLLTATPGDEEAEITFDAPTDTGGSGLTAFEVSIDDGTTWTYAPLSSPSTDPFIATFTELTNGQTYLVSVRAVNAQGNSPASNTMSVTPRTVPGAPTLTLAVPDDEIAWLYLTPPASDGGSAVTHYQASVDGGDTWTTLVTSDLDEPTAKLSGLTNGTSYDVIVRAVNAAGAGAPSTPTAVTPATVPDAPDLTNVFNGQDSKLQVVFLPPETDGGSPIAGYQVTTDGGDTWTSATTTLVDGGPAMRATVTGLTNGTTYSVSVRAVNAFGWGSAGVFADVTPFTVPGAPVLTSAEPVDGSVLISFEAPASDGGDAITGYEVSYGGPTWEPITVTGNGPLTASVSALPGTTEGLTVRAVNRAGGGTSSNSIEVTVSAPAELTLTGSAQYRGEFPFIDLDLFFMFTVPVSTGPPVNGYEYSIDDGGTWMPLSYTPGGMMNPWNIAEVPVLWDCQVFTVDTKVRALNEVGVVLESNTVPITTPECV